VRVPSGEPELVRAAGAGAPAALAALWDAYGPRVFAFCQRLLGSADAAADAAQDAFLLAHAELGSLAREGEGFGLAVFGAARTTCFELLARDGRAGRRGPASRLSAATARLRPQQRAALALTGLEGLSYAEIASVLGIGAEGVGALLARARLRLHDELHGTALAGAAVRSPDCEDVVPLLAAGADGELDAADAAWADPHVERCPMCPRTRRAMDETAATYAAWSPAVPPAWLGAATLAELGVQAPAAGTARAGRAAAEATPRPPFSAALVGAALVSVACAALLVAASGSLRQRDSMGGDVSLPEAARSLQVAGVPPSSAPRPAARKRRPHRTRHARAKRRPQRVALTPVRAVRRVASPRQPAATRRPAAAPSRPPASRPQRRPSPKPAAPAPAQPTTTTMPTPPTPANPAAPADELPGASASAGAGSTAGGSAAGAAPADASQAPATASAVQAPPPTTAAKTSTTLPPPVSGAPASAPPASGAPEWGASASAPPASGAPEWGASASAPPTTNAGGQHHRRGGGRHEDRRPSGPCPPPRGYRHR
jgi:DNA-directed RNA polymerase specialized sigma24 family protein